MKTNNLIIHLFLLAFTFPVILGGCSSENAPEPENDNAKMTIKTYKIGSLMELKENENGEGYDTKSSTPIKEIDGKKVYMYDEGGNGIILIDEGGLAKRSLAGEYQSNTLYIMGQNSSDKWVGLPCDVDRSIADKVYFNFYLDVTSDGNNVPQSFTFRNNGKSSITVPANKQVYYSSVPDQEIKMTKDAGWLPTPKGETTYKPYIESNYFRAKNCPLGVCAQGYPTIGEDIIYDNKDNELTVYLERLTAVFSVKIVLTNNQHGISENDWKVIFKNYGEPSDWCIASYITDFPIGYNMETKAFTSRGIVGLHDSNLPSFQQKNTFIYRNDSDMAFEDTYVAASDIRPRIFYYAEDRRPDVQVAIYYKYGQADEELRVASVPIPRFNSNQNWTLNLYVDVQQMLNESPVPRMLRSLNTEELPIQGYFWELD